MRKKILQGLNYGDYEISGQSLVYNQANEYGNFETGESVWGTASAVNLTIADNTATFTVKSGSFTSNYMFSGIRYFTSIVSHKYAIIFDVCLKYESTITVDSNAVFSPTSPTTETAPASVWTKVGTITNGAGKSQYLYIFPTNAKNFYGEGDMWKMRKFMIFDLTLLEQALGTTINTLDDFYATPVGQQVRKGVYLPYSPTNTILNAEFPIRVVGENLFNSENWYNNMKSVRPNTVHKEIINGKEYIKFKPDGLTEIRENDGNFKPNTQYTVSFYGFNENRTSSGFRFYYDDRTYSNIYVESTAESEYSLTSTAGKTIVSIGVTYNYNDYVFIRNIMLTEGTSPKPYVKYIDRKIDVGEPLELRGVGARNIWNEEWVKGRYINGVLNSAYGNLSSKDKIPVKGNTTYFFSRLSLGIGYGVYLTEYDANGNHLLSRTIYTTTFTTNADTRFINFGNEATYGIVYKHDISIYEGTTDYGYIPYGTTLIHDTYRNTTGKKKTMVGEVDLGKQPNIEKQGYGFSIYRPTMTTLPKRTASNDVIANALSDSLQVSTYSKVAGHIENNKIAIGTTNYLLINEDSLSTANEFKTKYDSSKFAFELETPTTDIYSSHALPKGITKAYDSHGMELYIKEK